MGTGYTRNDTANNIADGNVINASDLDGEFDAIQAAFNASTGHSHDGTTGEGPQIGTGGIADNAVTLGTKTSGNYVATGAVSGVGLSGSASAEGATFTVTSNATDANTASTIVARDASGNFSAGTITAALTGNVTGNVTGSSGSTTGNAATATALQTARTIAGNSFDGTANITIASTDLSDSGSINAATLDSLDSTQFLRSDAADTKTSGDLSFSDNVKAVFGAGSDLQIYHAGTSSRIQDVGTGNLIIDTDGTEIQITSGSVAKYMLRAVKDGDVKIYYDNAQKLATTATGVDVTGVLLADGVDLHDTHKIRIGTTGDLQLYHDGSNSYIDEAGAGGLKINANNSLVIGKYGASESMAVFDTDGAVTLYYDNAAKLATKSDGVDITGELQADSLDIDGNGDISGNLTLGGNLNLGDSDKAQFGASQDLQIFHDGSNSYIIDNGTGPLIIRGDTQILLQNTAGTEMITANSGGSVALRYNGSSKLTTTSSGVTVTGQLNADGLALGDNETAYFGTSGDLQIYHDGSNSFIHDNGTGSLYIDATQLNFRNGAQTQIYADFTSGGAARLAYNGNVKFQTTSSGIDVPGDINAVDNIYLASAIYHEGDTDTYTQFHGADQWRVVTGGTEMLEVNDSYLLLGANSVGSVETASKTGSVTPNLYVYNSFVWTLTGNITLTNPSTEVAGQSGVFIFIHSGAARTVSLGTDWETAGGAGLTLSSTSGAVDIVPYYVQASGNILLGTPQLAFA